MLGVDHTALSDLALSAPAGAGGLVLVPYLEGERTPNRPDATGALHGLRLETTTPAHSPGPRSRACCAGWPTAWTPSSGRRHRGAGAAGRRRRPSAALCRIAPSVLGHQVIVPPPGEYVADGAARQAAWVLAAERSPAGHQGDTVAPPDWEVAGTQVFDGDPAPGVRARYADVRDLTAVRPA